MGNFAPDASDLPGRGGGGGFAGFQDGVQAGAELLGGFEVGLVGGGLGGAEGFGMGPGERWWPALGGTSRAFGLLG